MFLKVCMNPCQNLGPKVSPASAEIICGPFVSDYTENFPAVQDDHPQDVGNQTHTQNTYDRKGRDNRRTGVATQIVVHSDDLMRRLPPGLDRPLQRSEHDVLSLMWILGWWQLTLSPLLFITVALEELRSYLYWIMGWYDLAIREMRALQDLRKSQIEVDHCYSCVTQKLWSYCRADESSR